MSLVLIIEDNDRNLELVRDILQAKGYRTLEASTAENGLEIARRQAPDLILMDIQLPGMSGIEALKVLRDDPATAALLVVAITASVMKADREQIMRAGFNGFIEKPITVRSFLEVVEGALQAKTA
ncbi:MAG TPA: response regulator [Burkholderiales bacterium]|nr:response regulator [Burkholderiales bacterium]